MGCSCEKLTVRGAVAGLFQAANDAIAALLGGRDAQSGTVGQYLGDAGQQRALTAQDQARRRDVGVELGRGGLQRQADEADDAILENLASYGYIKKTENGYVPTILVMRKEKNLKMPKEVRTQMAALHQKAGEIYSRHYLFCQEQIYNEIPAFLKEETIQILTACNLISAVLYYP